MKKVRPAFRLTVACVKRKSTADKSLYQGAHMEVVCYTLRHPNLIKREYVHENSNHDVGSTFFLGLAMLKCSEKCAAVYTRVKRRG